MYCFIAVREWDLKIKFHSLLRALHSLLRALHSLLRALYSLLDCIAEVYLTERLQRLLYEVLSVEDKPSWDWWISMVTANKGWPLQQS